MRVCLWTSGKFLLLFLLSTLSWIARVSSTEECLPSKRSVTIPVKVRVLFAGTVPLFMRDNFKQAARHAFLQHLSSTSRRKALPIETDPGTPIVTRLNPKTCSVVEYSFSFEIGSARAETAKRLDAVLSKKLSTANSIFVDATEMADSFHTEIESDPSFHDSTSIGVYNLLIYNALSIAPHYGYRGGSGGVATTTGIASGKRFAFVDVGARPYFLGNPGSLLPGEELMSVSHDAMNYAKKINSISIDLFTPTISPGMRRFPHENRLSFRLFLVDVSEAIGRKPGVAGDSLRNKPMGRTFDADKFAAILRQVLQDPAVSDKNISVETEELNMDTNPHVGMAVIRAFSTKGLQIILDADQLYADVVSGSSFGGSFFVDRSFVAHIPLYLFSVADDSRTTHFDTDRQTQARVVRNQAVFMIENRLRSEIDEHASITAEAVKQVLELLCGLGETSLGLISLDKGHIPLLARDITRRNLLVQELDWSRATASWKATEVLNYEGLDRRLIPHEEGSVISKGQKSVKERLRRLHSAWDEAAASFSWGNVEAYTTELLQKSQFLADRLHEEICNQPLPEEILLKAEVEMEPVMRDVKTRIRRLNFTDILWVVIPGILGTIMGLRAQSRSRRRKPRASLLDDVSAASAVPNRDVAFTTRWFSTMVASDKSKVN